jgi:glutamate N-acetyltransferase/amino-acid N-acetyltransferase
MNESTSFVVPAGFRAAAVKSGIKPSGGLDLAVFAADRTCVAAGTFTLNRVAAAPVQWCRSLLPSDRIRAVVVNAGNANAATGEQGLANVGRTADAVARLLGCPGSDEVLVASTGVIGRQLPIERMESSLPDAIATLDSSVATFDAASRAIMTTDTRPKVVSQTLETSHGPRTVLGVAKGAAMIGPNMATMLAFLFTDAAAGPGQLQGILGQAVDSSFNCISVEGHTSTNDTVLMLAQRDAALNLKGHDLERFGHTVKDVCTELARLIVDDGEGATHRITIDVEGCGSEAEAKAIAAAVANSALVKTAIHGADPNWGRIVSAAGYAGVPFDEPEMSLWLNGIALYQAGAPVPFDAAALSKDIRANRETSIRLAFTRGENRTRFWTCDLTAEFIRLNADYTT